MGWNVVKLMCGKDMNLHSLKILVCGVIFSHSLYSQEIKDFERYKQMFPDEQGVVLNDIGNLTIDVEDGKYVIKEEIIKEIMILSTPKPFLTNDKVFESHLRKIIEIDAKTLVPDGKKYKTEKVKKFIDQKDTEGDIVYDDVVAKTFVYPSVQPGAITSLRYEAQILNPYALSSFFFKWNMPTVLSQVTVKADKRAKISYKLFNTEKSNIDFSVKEKGKYLIYSWTVKDISPSKYESNDPDIRYYYPHIVYYIDNAVPGDTTDMKKRGLNNLYQYYCSLVKGINSKQDTTIQSLVNKLITGAKNDDEKVKRIYYWVQDNIKYIAFEEGMQGYIPDDAVNVYNKRYGDCKGMSSIINYMLTMAGVKSYFTWIGTRSIPYKYTELPTIAADNHMIVTYYNMAGKPVFLDATGQYQPIELPSSMIQGKEALVGIDENNYKIENVPVIAADINVHVDSTLFTFKNNIIEGNGVVTYKGYDKFYYSYSVDEKDPKRLKEKLLDILEKGHNKFFIDSFDITHLNDREKPLEIAYKFRINDYYKELDNEVYINMNLSKLLRNAQYNEADRKNPVENNYYKKYVYKTILQIPDGYSLSSLPKNSELQNDKLKYKIVYSVEGNKIIQYKEIVFEFLIMQANELKQWNEVVDKLTQAYRDVVILKKNK